MNLLSPYRLPSHGFCMCLFLSAIVGQSTNLNHAGDPSMQWEREGYVSVQTKVCISIGQPRASLGILEAEGRAGS